MANQSIVAALHRAKWLLQINSPIDTGNLRYNAVRLKSLGNNTWELYVDEKIAPYMKYTNEPWQSKKGIYRKEQRKNPNEGWFNDAIADIIALIVQLLPSVSLIRGVI